MLVVCGYLASARLSADTHHIHSRYIVYTLSVLPTHSVAQPLWLNLYYRMFQPAQRILLLTPSVAIAPLNGPFGLMIKKFGWSTCLKAGKLSVVVNELQVCQIHCCCCYCYIIQDLALQSEQPCSQSTQASKPQFGPHHGAMHCGACASNTYTGTASTARALEALLLKNLSVLQLLAVLVSSNAQLAVHSTKPQACESQHQGCSTTSCCLPAPA